MSAIYHLCGKITIKLAGGGKHLNLFLGLPAWSAQKRLVAGEWNLCYRDRYRKPLRIREAIGP
jgi:hypothetical protein